jgi:hypothetical protein
MTGKPAHLIPLPTGCAESTLESKQNQSIILFRHQPTRQKSDKGNQGAQNRMVPILWLPANNSKLRGIKHARKSAKKSLDIRFVMMT